LEGVGKRPRRASRKTDFVGEKRAKAETEKDFFDSVVAVDKAPLVVPLTGVKALVDVSDFVKQNFTDVGWLADAQVGGQPKTLGLIRATAEGEYAYLQRGN
jgi:hypothetical protein